MKTFVAVTMVMLIALAFCSCSFQIGFDYVGKTGKSDTTISKEFVSEAKPVSYRRY